VASVIEAAPRAATPLGEGRRVARDSLLVALAGQAERVLGTVTALLIRWGLDPARLGVYAGLRISLDQTNRSSLGVGLGAVQEIPILRASGREDEARRVADVAHATNLVTCLLYALGLLAWAFLRAPYLADDPLAREWTWGLVAVAGLALLKRYESFLIAVLRARQEFAVTAQVDVVEALVSIAAVGLGLAVAGFWGLLGSVAVILGAKVAFLHARQPYRFGLAWDWPTASRLMATGLPILANTAAFGAVMNLDRVVILWRVPDGERALGLYATMALMGTGWSLDLAGRIVTVLYPYFQTTLGRTGDRAEVARRAMKATEVQAPILAAGGAVAYFAGPVFLGGILPRYLDGLPALRPLLPGATLLGLAWPARQALIAVGRPYRLAAATLAGLVACGAAGVVGADRGGIVGVAWGMSAGYAAVFLLTSATAFGADLGARAWLGHLGRLAAGMGWMAFGVLLAGRIAPGLGAWGDLTIRLVALAAWALPALGVGVVSARRG
jgi:O-antigen/teichoic acid export membrane protein